MNIRIPIIEFHSQLSVVSNNYRIQLHKSFHGLKSRHKYNLIANKLTIHYIHITFRLGGGKTYLVTIPAEVQWKKGRAGSIQTSLNQQCKGMVEHMEKLARHLGPH